MKNHLWVSWVIRCSGIITYNGANLNSTYKDLKWLNLEHFINIRSFPSVKLGEEHTQVNAINEPLDLGRAHHRISQLSFELMRVTGEGKKSQCFGIFKRCRSRYIQDQTKREWVAPLEPTLISFWQKDIDIGSSGSINSELEKG